LAYQLKSLRFQHNFTGKALNILFKFVQRLRNIKNIFGILYFTLYYTFNNVHENVSILIDSLSIFVEIQCQKVKYNAENEIVTMQKVRIIQKVQTLRVTKFSNKIVYIKIIYFACDQRMDMIA
jgi:hypothetical protein